MQYSSPKFSDASLPVSLSVLVPIQELIQLHEITKKQTAAFDFTALKS